MAIEEIIYHPYTKRNRKGGREKGGGVAVGSKWDITVDLSATMTVVDGGEDYSREVVILGVSQGGVTIIVVMQHQEWWGFIIVVRVQYYWGGYVYYNPTPPNSPPSLMYIQDNKHNKMGCWLGLWEEKKEKD